MRFEEYYEPATVSECCGLLSRFGADAKILAGGTDVVPRLKSKAWKPVAMIDIRKIEGLDAIKVTDEGLELGAMARLRKISQHPALEKDYAVIREAAGHVSSMQVRNVATIGGNACNASPSADAIQGLLLLDAVAVIAGDGGKREVPLAAFFTGPGKTVLGSNEILVCFKVPKPQPHTGAYYEKYAIRGDTDISIVGAGAAVTLDESGRVAKAVVSLAAVAPTPLRMSMVEELITGQELNDKLIEKAARMASENIMPISDQRATAAYRVEMIYAWTKHALEKALARAKQA